ncbi:MAG: hypothetical protein QW622_00555 [Candidatus Pacearchaeota archaeon]
MNKEVFYPGLSFPPPESAYSDLFIGYRFPTGKLGATASAMTLNQIQEVNNRLSTGMKFVEAGVISPETFEKIPKQHFEEIARLAKITGSEVTWHAPIVDPAGLSEGGKISDEARMENETFLFNAIERATVATGGNQPITIHATAGIPAGIITRKVDGKEVIEKVGVVNTLENNVGFIPASEIQKIIPEEIAAGKKPEPITREQIKAFLEEKNKEEWKKFVNSLERRKSEIEDFIKHFPPKHFEEQLNKLKESYSERLFLKPLEKLNEEEKKLLESTMYQEYPESKTLETSIVKSNLLFNELKDHINTAFRIAWKASEEDKVKQEKLKQIAEEITKITPDKEGMLVATKVFSKLNEFSPEFLKLSEDFAREKASETIGNLAVKSYEKFKDKAPILSIENVYPDTAFGRGEELKKLIIESREKFVEKMKDKLGEKKAKEIAEKIIGATWDIGHINLLRKYGFEALEAKADLEEIKPFIKHIHLTDNFGFTDSHLPPGMGGIPKEIFAEIAELTKAGIKGVLEVPTIALPPPHGMGVSPYPFALAALGSPLYTYEMAPFWNQALAANVPAYFTGYGPILPEQHFSIYGSGFSGLPVELGGQMPRKGFGEVPME